MANQKHCPSIRRNMQALPPRRVTVLQRSDKNRLKKPYRNASKSTRPPKRSATTKVTYCKLLRKTQGQASFLDRHVRNMEHRRGPLNRRIKRYSILQQLNFGDSSHANSLLVLLLNFKFLCSCSSSLLNIHGKVD